MKTIICLDGETWAIADGTSIVCVTDEAFEALEDGSCDPEDLDPSEILSETILHFPC